VERGLRSVAVGIVLLGAAAGYGAGVVGPPVRAISEEFGVSLTSIGLLTSVFFVGVVGLNLAAPWVERWLGLRRAVRLAPLLLAAGNVISALASAFWVVLAGRVVLGVGVAIVLVLAPIAGRSVGGARLIGIYGGAISIGVAVSLALGGALESAGVDWRVNFGIAALLGGAASPFFFGRFPDTPETRKRAGRELARAFLTRTYWPVALLFVLVAGIPLVVGAWIVHYLTSDDAMSAGVAGIVGFLLFAVSTAARPVGGRVDERHHPLLLAASPFLAAAGLGLLAVDNAPALAVAAIVVLGVGFSIPYAVSYVRAEDLVPGRPTVGLSAELLVVNVTPMVVTPLVGAALDGGHARAAWLALAVFAAVAGAANLTRRAIPVSDRRPAA
jgi:cyanate permease